MHRNKRLKLYFGGQKATRPPRIEIQVNNPDAVSASYEKFLLNTLRERFDLGGTPLRFTFVGRSARRSDRKPANAGEMPEMVGYVDLYANPLEDDEEPDTWLEDIEDDWDGDDGDAPSDTWDDDDDDDQAAGDDEDDDGDVEDGDEDEEDWDDADDEADGDETSAS